MTVHSFFEARRTTIRPGREEEYARVHASIPRDVEDALARAGVLGWRIWRDGGTLFHQIETREGYDAMLRVLHESGTRNPEWDDTIQSLLDSEPGADVMLPLVWSMTPA